jgi:hypothetical protein
MGVEIVHHQSHFLSVGIALFEHCADKLSPVKAGSVLGDLHMSSATEGFHFDENLRHAVADILVVINAEPAWSARDRGMNFSYELLAGFVHANEREVRIVGSVIKF